MKKYILFSISLLSLTLVGCKDFLDHAPDNRTEIDTQKKVQLLLVNAYNYPNYGPLCEFSSDNIIDNNTPDDAGHVNTKVPFSPMFDEIFAWQDVTTESQQDSPYYIWQYCYSNIAVANQALKAIETLEADGTDMSAERAEALICRAYNHFILVNVFCQAYKNANQSKNDIGIYYMTEPETTVKPQYDRGNVADVYAHIEEDLTAALPNISDTYYQVPKYHFNLKAAYAFAARFYLYKRDWDKVITYADKVLGSSAASAASLMFDADNCKRKGNIELEMYAWFDAKSNANLHLQTTYSFALYSFVPSYCRYTFNRVPRDYTFLGSGPCWSDRFPGTNIWHYNQNYGGFLAKMYEPFEYTDKVAGIGYAHSLRREFTTGETLLCRAEAKIMKGDLDGAVADMDVWAKGYMCTKDLTEKNIKQFFYRGNSDRKAVQIRNAQLAPELHNSDMSSDWVISDDVRPFIWCVLHFRRLETMHDGLRWFDIKRYGIEIKHEIGYPVVTKTLTWNDDRRAIQLPQEAIEAGQTANPRQVIGDNSTIVTSTASTTHNDLLLYTESMQYPITILK